MNPLKAIKKRKKARQSRRHILFEKIKPSWVKGFNSLFRTIELRAFSDSVSGNTQITSVKFDKAKAVAAHTGRVTLNSARAVPSPGPSTKPKPKATPISPKVFARFSGVDISAKTAVAVAAVPPLIPSIILAMNRSIKGKLIAQVGRRLLQSKLTVKANKQSPITDPDTQVTIIGLRPKRSLKAPINGATANWEIA